ncbi:Fumarate reductase iron-sulfur subunit [Candidatus Rubidus massiliensis]|nr:Fumarate reductase iron-sulfur subunit [Candidatus Rubidus massiliensis]
MEKTFILKILRGNPGKQYWEEFELMFRPGMNVITALMDIQKNPINKKGEKVTPVVWESGCLEEVCGSCSMLINQKPRQACTALIEYLIKETQSSIIVLAPFTKFPLIKDLIVDRSVMFDNLKKIHAWIDVDSTHDRGPGPKISQELQETRYSLSTCMTCGCCVEACPQADLNSSFIGPQIFAQARLFNDHPIGKLKEAKRLEPLLEKGGISDCGNAQNCVKVCPRNVPLTDAIAKIGRSVVKYSFKKYFGFSDD